MIKRNLRWYVAIVVAFIGASGLIFAQLANDIGCKELQWEARHNDPRVDLFDGKPNFAAIVLACNDTKKKNLRYSNNETEILYPGQCIALANTKIWLEVQDPKSGDPNGGEYSGRYCLLEFAPVKTS